MIRTLKKAIMASLETISERIFREPDSIRKLLIGAALCLSILGLPWALGYLFAYAYSLRGNPRAPLPAWEHWQRLGTVGLHGLAVFAAWFALPVLVAHLVAALFALAPGGVLGLFGWLAIGISWLIAPALFTAALVHYQRERDWRALIDFEAIAAPLQANWMGLLVPSLAWCGLLALALPLLPFAFFLGMTLYLAYAVPVLADAGTPNQASD